jgi:hypothetical protein
MVNNFFNSLEYISLLEDSAINGNGSAIFKMHSKTRKLLGEKNSTANTFSQNKERVLNEILEILKTGCTIADALFACGKSRNEYYKYLDSDSKIRIKQTRKKYFTYKKRNNWYNND